MSKLRRLLRGAQAKLRRLLLGRTLATSEGAERKIGVLSGIPALGLDGLSSSAYGPEAALTILLPLSAAGLVYIGPIILVILGLLAASKRGHATFIPASKRGHATLIP
jgi:hypothetical protein